MSVIVTLAARYRSLSVIAKPAEQAVAISWHNVTNVPEIAIACKPYREIPTTSLRTGLGMTLWADSELSAATRRSQ